VFVWERLVLGWLGVCELCLCIVSGLVLVGGLVWLGGLVFVWERACARICKSCWWSANENRVHHMLGCHPT